MTSANSDKPSLILSSLDQLRKVNAELRKENSELADTYEALLNDMECLKQALDVLKNIVEMGGNTYDRRSDCGQCGTSVQEEKPTWTGKIWDNAVRKQRNT